MISVRRSRDCISARLEAIVLLPSAGTAEVTITTLCGVSSVASWMPEDTVRIASAYCEVGAASIIWCACAASRPASLGTAPTSG